MRTRIPLRLANAALLVLAVAAAATDTLASKPPPVAIRLKCELAPAKGGVPYAGTVELGILAPGTLDGFRFEGKGWQTRRLEAPSRILAEKGESYLLDFEIMADDPTQPVTFTLAWDGRSLSRTFDLSPEAFRNETEPIRSQSNPFANPLRGIDPGYVKPQPTANSVVDLYQAETTGKAARTIHAFGNYFYYRPDGKARGLPYSTYTIYYRLAPFDFDIPLAAGMTDVDGWFECWFQWDPEWFDDENPDLIIRLRASNSAVAVETPFWEQDYVFEHFKSGFPGTEFSFGTMHPSSEQGNNVAHIFRTISLAWSWFSGRLNQQLPYVEVQFPDGDRMYYVADPIIDNSEIHAGGERTWWEGSLIHEYGHHWMYNFGYWHEPAYWCNGHGDPLDPWLCLTNPGHARWCSETTTDAVNEGLPHFIADVICRSFLGDYGDAVYVGRDMEKIEKCTEDEPDALNDPNLTEGFFGAVLRDLEDPYDPPFREDDPNFPGSDVCGAGPEIILGIANQETYDSPMEFLLKCKARGEFPGALWSTARNCGYELDTEPPGAPTQIVSSSHLIVGDSPDPTIDFTWTLPYDDLSGIQGYSVEFTPSSLPAVMPDETIDTYTGESGYTSPILPEGSWWFSVRAVDHSGKWSPDWNYAGPYTIREAIPADLIFAPRAGWNGMIVAREVNNSLPDNVPAPTLLLGNSASTWCNWSWINSGEVNWPDTWFQGLYLDGTWVDNWGQVSTPPGVSSYAINIGPTEVRGGRHTLQLLLDTTGLIHESNGTNDAEANNGYARQFVWTPLWIDPGVRVQRPAPPDPTGGWEDIPTGPFIFKYYNCDGLSFGSSGWWNAVVIRAEGDDYNYDCRLYNHSTGPFDGFSLTADISEFPAGQIDAVLVNKRTMGSAIWDVGVMRNISSAGTSGNDGYEAMHVTSQFLPRDTQTTVTLNPYETLALREFYVGSGDLGHYSIYLGREGSAAKGWALLLDKDFARGSLDDWVDYCYVIPPFTESRMDIEVTEAGHYCLVVYRELDDINVTANYPLRIESTRPNAACIFAQGWHSAIVPRPAQDTTPSSVPVPTILYGDAGQTYLNRAVGNLSPTPLSGLTGGIYLDETPLLNINWGPIGPDEYVLENLTSTWFVRGGRHALSLRLDEFDAIGELAEDDNRYAEQYIWEPTTMSYATPLSRSVPPARTAGWGDINYLLNGILYFNCDGLRTPATTGYWVAAAVMPGSETDVDIRFHELSAGAKDGFGESQAQSGWIRGESDYSLINFNQTPFVQHDVGVLHVEGDEPYTVEAVSADFVGYFPDGTFGPVDMGAGHIIRLHEAYLAAGTVGIRLENLSGSVDWGLTLHAADAVYASKSESVLYGTSWIAGPGESEEVHVTIGEEGYYCLAVWKRRTDDLPLGGSYQMVFQPGVSGVGDFPLVPDVTRLDVVHPNPFNPQTTVIYDVARPTRVQIGVFDLRGLLVRSLLDAPIPAGRHEIIWDGRDDRGGYLASGVYMVRMATDEPVTLTHRKVTLLK